MGKIHILEFLAVKGILATFSPLLCIPFYFEFDGMAIVDVLYV